MRSVAECWFNMPEDLGSIPPTTERFPVKLGMVTHVSDLNTWGARDRKVKI